MKYPFYVVVDGRLPDGPFATIDAARREAAAYARVQARGGIIVNGDTGKPVERFEAARGVFESVAFTSMED